MIDPVSILFFILFLYIVIHPQLQLRALTNSRLKLIKEIEKNMVGG